MSMARELEDGPENEVEDEPAGAMMLFQRREEFVVYLVLVNAMMR
jgi:hypothetical protein